MDCQRYARVIAALGLGRSVVDVFDDLSDRPEVMASLWPSASRYLTVLY